MKIRLLFALVLMTFSVFGQNVPSYVPTNGLVGWWPFNGNADDESGNGNNGTVNGAILTSDRNGNASNAYSYDGATSYIVLPSMNIGSSNSASSVSIWWRESQNITSNWGTMISDYSQPLFSTLIQRNFSQNFNSVNRRSASDEIQAYSDSILDNNWHHCVIVFDGTSRLYFYSDNLLEDSMVVWNGVSQGNYSIPYYNSTINYYNGLPFYFGCSNVGGNLIEFWSGDIDDIGIWNRALTQQEITNLYNSSLPTSIPIINCPGAFISPNLSNGLVGWWPFCGDADDESGNGNNGTVNGATLTSDRFGNGNSAYEFDGVDDFIQTNLIGPAGRTTRSFSFWISTISASEQAPIDFNLNPGNSFSIELNNPCPGIGVDCGSGVAMKGNNGIINGLWHHCVLVYDSLRHTTISDVDVFIDGQLQTAVTCSALDPNCVINNTNPSALIFGKTGSNVRFVNGKLDDIGYWNRALDSSEVAQLYNTGLCTQTIAGSCDTLIFNANITGFNPVTYANQIKVYPNPASDNLVIDCGTNYTGLNGYSIRITNLLGQTVYNSPVTAQITNIQLNPPTWVNGTYVVQFVHPNGTVLDTKRIIIQ